MSVLQSLIKDIMQDKTYTEARIAKYAGVSPSTIRRIRKGQTAEPHYQTINKLLTLYFTVQYNDNKKT